MIVLDTNVVSELMRPDPAAGVVAWVDRRPADEVFLTAVTAAELLYGVTRLPSGNRKATLALKVRELLEEDFEGRVLPFDVGAADHYADIVVSRERAGRPVSMADAQIAAVCRCFNADLATRNVKDFGGNGVRILDPWDD